MKRGLYYVFNSIYTVGVSSPNIRARVVEYIEKMNPKRIFDIACGTGAYGFFIKQKLRKCFIIGLDGFHKYLTGVYVREFYNNVIEARVEELLNGNIRVKSDLILCMDVVEHFEKEDALKLLGWLQKQKTPVIISTPLFKYKQGAVEGNALEEHKCWFSGVELERLGWKCLFKEPWLKGKIGAFIN